MFSKYEMIARLTSEVNNQLPKDGQLSESSVCAVVDSLALMVRESLVNRGVFKIHGLGLFKRKASGKTPMIAEDDLMNVSVDLQGIELKSLRERLDQMQHTIDVVHHSLNNGGLDVDHDQFRQIKKDLRAFGVYMYEEGVGKEGGMRLKKNSKKLIGRITESGVQNMYCESQFVRTEKI